MLVATRNPAFRRTLVQLARFVATDAPIVLEGETGTGKSLLARRIHGASRPGRPFVTVDLGAVPGGLVPAELFGHRAGAFTDAMHGREGRFARAGNGTIVLDRLETAPPEAQIALLRVLEERRFTPIGGTAPERLEARIVALADVGLPERVARGEVRSDLFHRLAGFHAVLPPLRDRREDVRALARSALRRLVRRLGRPLDIDEEAFVLLEAHSWPGNVRELEATLTRAALTADGSTIGAARLGLPPDAWEDVAALAMRRHASLAEVERTYALWVLAAERGNVTRAARVLGISRRTLIRWRRG
jgi:DNA-binding NtrC family response regulator